MTSLCCTLLVATISNSLVSAQSPRGALPSRGEIARATEPAPAAASAHREAAAPELAPPTELGPVFRFSDRTFVADSALAARIRAQPESFDATLVLGDGESVAVHLQRFEAVRPGVAVRVAGTTRADLADAARAVVNLRGEVLGEPGSLVAISVSDRGAAGLVDRGPGRARYTLRAVRGEAPGLASGEVRFDLSGGNSDPAVPLCATDDDAGGIAGIASVPPGVHPLIEVAVDTDYEYYSIFDDPVAATEYITALYAAISAIYTRDCDASVAVSFVRLWDTPDDLFNEPDPLGPFADWWDANMGDIHRDVAQLLTGRRNLPYGGVAWVSAACGDLAYSVNGYIIGQFADPVVTNPGNWDIIVVAHELGHNVGTLHTHSYGLDSCDSGTVQRGSIMSYCHINSGGTANIDLRFHSVTAAAIEDFIVSAECLESDCDGDGVFDVDAIALGLVPDANGDLIPDSCQDCDGDGVLDPIAIAEGLVVDSDGNGRPDSCEPDCNANGIPDESEIAMGLTLDAYGDKVPDECEPDCNGNGIADYSDIQAQMTIDRGRDALIDACQDCDGDGIDDLSELEGSLSVWVSSEFDGAVRELHPRSGVQLRTVAGPQAPIYDLVIPPDGTLWGSSGREIVRFDRVAGTYLGPVISLAIGVDARGMAVAQDGAVLVATSQGGVRRIASAGAPLEWFVNPSATNAPIDPRDVAIRADGNVLVSCGDGRVRRYTYPDGVGSILIDESGSPTNFAGVFELPDGDVIVASRAQQDLLRYDGMTGTLEGRFDVQPGSLLTSPWGLAPSADGRSVLATSSTSSSTVNGYNLDSGYLERTYRVYGADAPAARAIAVAPASATDANGNLVPDECESVVADLDGDGQVGPADLAILLGAWGTAAADLTGDGTTDAADLAILLGAWS